MDRGKVEQGLQFILDRYKSNEGKQTSERDVCRVYIEPLFELLGWDLKNVDEVKEQVSQPQGRPDYIFYLAGSVAFFLETKTVRDLTEEDIKQAINYGRSKNKRWAILSNFKETLILICDTKEDTVWKHVFRRIKVDEITKQIDYLMFLSRDSLVAGELDKKAQEEGRVRQTVRIDDELLEDILKWRQKLMTAIKKNDKKEYTKAELEEIVQTLLNRIIFIRTVEDRRHEARPDETIRAILNQYDKDKSINLTHRMNKLFLHYDESYDSKLFTYDEQDSSKRHECEKVEIENPVYAKILKETYDKDAIYSYNFGDIDADILGAMYEKYIGTIQSKRKEQGIYYTPSYIVEYIVQNTLGKVLEGTKVDDVPKIKVLDMACGSGSFLLKAFDIIDDYLKHEDKSYAQTMLDADGFKAKMTRKTLILKDNIFGVDLDPKAVEVSQLNLLLKAAETRHRLPDLRSNIKYGNSLISQSLTEEMHPFEWNKEFPLIMENGGFDVVIGNPPYVRQEELLGIKPYLERNYEVYHSMADLFVYFFERELKVLKDGGYLGIIVSNKWLKAGYGENLRRFLNQYYIEQFIDFGDLPVFQDATTYPCIIIIRKQKKQNPKMMISMIKTLQFDSLDEYIKQHSFRMNQRDLDSKFWNFADIITTNLLKKIYQKSVPLKEYVGNRFYYGIKTGLTQAFVINEQTKNELLKKDPKSIEIIRPFLMGKEVQRYRINYRKKYLIVTKTGTDLSKYPAILEWMTGFRAALTKRTDNWQQWFELRPCAYYDMFEKPKLVYARITVGPRFTLDRSGYYTNDANYFLATEDLKLLAILNSKLGWFLISNTCTQIRGGYQLIWKYFSNVPISKDSSADLESAVEKIIVLHEKLQTFENKQMDECKTLEKEIDDLNSKIDQLVYDLYGLTNEERKVVEDSVGSIKDWKTR